MTAKIQFLASYPKSGNTWCRVFLANYIGNTEEPVRLDELSGTTGIASERSLVERWTGVESSLLTEGEIADLKKEGLLLMNRKLKEWGMIKVHDAFPLQGEPDWFPEDAVAGVVYIVRNPLDVTKSLADHIGVSVDEAVRRLNDDNFALSETRNHLNLQFRQLLHSWSGHVESWLDGYKGQLCRIRYEDMQTEPVATFGKIVRALGYEYDEMRLKKAIRNSDFKVLKKDEEEHGFKERSRHSQSFFREGRAGAWRKHLSDRNVRDIVNRHRVLMTRLGYLSREGEILI
jgi:hypothetical protein